MRTLFAIAIFGASLLVVVVAATAFIYLTYDVQADRVAQLERTYNDQAARVAELEQENTNILKDHVILGRRLAAVTTPKVRVLLPRKLAPLRTLVQRGFLAPRRLPRSIAGENVSIGKYRDGYSLTWRSGLTLFARARQPLEYWTSQTPRRGRETVTIGKRRVLRLAGAGTVYAWREKGRTYALLTPPTADRLARRLIAAMR